MLAKICLPYEKTQQNKQNKTKLYLTGLIIEPQVHIPCFFF